MIDRPAPRLPQAALAAACLALAAGWSLLLPPEVHPEGGAGVAALLAAAIVLGGRPIRTSAVLWGLGLLAVNLAFSFAPGRTLETSTRALLALAAFLAAAGVSRSWRWLVLLALAAVGILLTVHAVLQKLGLLAWQAAWARAAGAPAEMVARLEEGRAFASHVVPAALAGGLVIAAAAGLALTSRGGAWRKAGFWAAAAALLGIVLTGSIGGWLGLAGLLAVGLGPRWRRFSWKTLGAALGILLAAGVGIAQLRPVSPFDVTRKDHPLRLRSGNWRGALLIASRQPVLGSGLGSYGALYPGVRRPGDSQTVYAHNSWLQLAVEGGIPALILLGCAAWCGARRVRRNWAAPADMSATVDRWTLAGGAAFALHNLVDFTAYLPGVAVPALALAGLAWSREEEPEGRPSVPSLAGLFGVVTLLVAVGGMWGAEALARRGLERAWEEAAQGSPAWAAEEAARAARLAPWSPGILLKSGRLLAAPGQPAQAAEEAERVARRLIAADPHSPAGWHLKADLLRAAGRPGEAWQAYERAALRHPADAGIKARIAELETALRGAGLLADQPGLLQAPPRPGEYPWEDWDRLLFLLYLGVFPLVLWRWWRPGPAPAAALALGVLLFLLPWGEGAALPGARLGRQLLAGVALAVSLFPRFRDRDQDRHGLDPAPWWRAAPLLIWAGACALLAPDRAAARDGWLALAGALVLLALSWELSRRFLSWPQVVLFLGAAAASFAGLLWVGQQVALRAGVDLDAWWVPLRVASGQRPAADFLHPGHLGTFLAAAGLGLFGLGFAQGRGRLPFGMGALLVLVGLGGGARSTLVAVAAAGVALFTLAARPYQRRLALRMIVPALAVGAILVWLRFSSGDPYAWTRWSIWKACLGALADRPWWGFGPDGFGPFAAGYAFPDVGPIARFGRVFHGPHSDLLGVFLALGIPGGLLVLGGLAGLFHPIWRQARARLNEEPALAGCAVAAAALAAHALFDDLFAERPAAALFFVLLLGAAAGRALKKPGQETALWRPGKAAGAALASLLLTAILAGEVGPWAADHLFRAGAAQRAALLDPWRAPYWAEAAGAVSGPLDRRLALALERTARAVEASPVLPQAWAARASVLDAACRGPLGTEDTCRGAVAAWEAALALRPHDVQARRLLGRLLAATGRTAPAEQALRRALEDEPNYLGARLDLARLLFEAGRREAAREEFFRLEGLAGKLKGVTPENGYAAALVTVNREEWSRLSALLAAGSP